LIKYGSKACNPASCLKLASAAVRFAKSLLGGNSDVVSLV
jgi:hypothetical protein